jgi:hypothetical protein
MAGMALPQTSGDQAAYIALGLPSISLASRPQGPAVGGNLATEDALGDAGRTAETLVASLDLVDSVAAPAAGVIINGRELRPVMSRIVILLLALPILVAALDLAVRLRRAGVRLLPFAAAILWRFVPVIVALLVAHLLATAGMLAGSSGGWPPLPDEVPFDLAAIVAIVLSIGAGVLAWLLVRHRATRRDAEVASRAGSYASCCGWPARSPCSSPSRPLMPPSWPPGPPGHGRSSAWHSWPPFRPCSSCGGRADALTVESRTRCGTSWRPPCRVPGESSAPFSRPPSSSSCGVWGRS